MEKTKPLKDIIAELQAIEDANQGILCTFHDHEWGMSFPNAAILPVYVNDYSELIVAEPSHVEAVNSLLEEYTHQTPEQMWENLGIDAHSEYENIEEFKKDFERIKDATIREFERMKTAIPMVVFNK